MNQKHINIALIGILLVAFGFRVWTLQNNWFMHGDVMGDVSVTAELVRDGLFVSHYNKETADPAAYTLPPASEGEPLIQHGPFWPMLGATVTALRQAEPTYTDAFLSLRILSLVAGLFVVYLCYVLARKLFSPLAGLAIAAWVACSYMLADYAGNGSFYSIHAVYYLLWLLLAYQTPSLTRSLQLGILVGLAYLTNFQCVILVPATCVLLLVQVRPWRDCVKQLVVFGCVTLAVMSPWLIRSMLLFNMPFYSEAWNMGYVYTKAGLGHLSVEETIHAGLQEKLIVLKHAIFPWLPNNLFYGARKLFLLTPIAFFFACFGLVDVWFSRERLRSIAPLIILLAFHTLVVAAYPVWKFRYFVPMLPLVFLFALDQLWHIRIAERTRNLLCGGVLVAVLAVSVWTYIETAPAHTTYYDGAMTQDPFHANEEKSFQESYHISFPNDAP